MLKIEVSPKLITLVSDAKIHVSIKVDPDRGNPIIKIGFASLNSLFLNLELLKLILL